MVQLLLGVAFCDATGILLDREGRQILRQLLLAPVFRHGRGHHELVGGDSSHCGGSANGAARPILGVEKGLKLSLRHEAVVK